jgi:hypothetical protein
MLIDLSRKACVFQLLSCSCVSSYPPSVHASLGSPTISVPSVVGSATAAFMTRGRAPLTTGRRTKLPRTQPSVAASTVTRPVRRHFEASNARPATVLEAIIGGLRSCWTPERRKGPDSSSRRSPFADPVTEAVCPNIPPRSPCPGRPKSAVLFIKWPLGIPII